MSAQTQEAFGKPKLRNATQSSGQTANETVARPGPSAGQNGASAKPNPATGTQLQSIPDNPVRPSKTGDVAKGRAVDGMPKSARPGGSTPARGKS
jgi:hypothetical protein